MPAILNLALPSLLVTFLNGLLAAFSESYVVVLGIYYKLQTFLYLPPTASCRECAPSSATTTVQKSTPGWQSSTSSPSA